jgi:hypothetical protein
MRPPPSLENVLKLSRTRSYGKPKPKNPLAKEVEEKNDEDQVYRLASDLRKASPCNPGR